MSGILRNRAVVIGFVQAAIRAPITSGNRSA
jgi:hypothetical protein